MSVVEYGVWLKIRHLVYRVYVHIRGEVVYRGTNEFQDGRVTSKKGICTIRLTLVLELVSRHRATKGL